MSSATVSTFRKLASTRAAKRLSSTESVSGIMIPKTCSAPGALAPKRGHHAGVDATLQPRRDPFACSVDGYHVARPLDDAIDFGGGIAIERIARGPRGMALIRSHPISSPVRDAPGSVGTRFIA